MVSSLCINILQKKIRKKNSIWMCISFAYVLCFICEASKDEWQKQQKARQWSRACVHLCRSGACLSSTCTLFHVCVITKGNEVPDYSTHMECVYVGNEHSKIIFCLCFISILNYFCIDFKVTIKFCSASWEISSNWNLVFDNVNSVTANST